MSVWCEKTILDKPTDFFSAFAVGPHGVATNDRPRVFLPDRISGHIMDVVPEAKYCVMRQFLRTRSKAS
ncbi:hypothetical protein Plhal304r1_c012g0047441 [Plasmopara halstedii]